MAEIRPLPCTQLTKRLETKSTQCTELYNMLTPYIANGKTVTTKQLEHLNSIACSMFDVLSEVAKIPGCEGNKSHPALAHAYTLKQTECLESKYYKRPEDMDSGAESADEDEELIIDRNVVPLGSAAGAKTKNDIAYKTDSESDKEEDKRPENPKKNRSESDKEDEKLPENPKKKRKASKAPKDRKAPKNSKVSETSETSTEAKKHEKSETIPVSDDHWQDKLQSLMTKMESKVDASLVQEMIEMFTSGDGVFHADVLFQETNIEYFKIIANSLDNQHVQEGYKFFIDRVFADCPFEFDTQEIKNWVEDTTSPFHLHVYPGDTGKIGNTSAVEDKTPPKVKAMLEFIDAVCDPSMIVDPKWESTYEKNPTGFFKMCASILRRHMELIDPQTDRSPKALFPFLHKIFNNMKESLKSFYTKNPRYAELGGKYEVIDYGIKNFHFKHVLNGFMNKIKGDYERRFMMCFDGVTSKYIMWCHTSRVNPCNFLLNPDKIFCAKGCAYCTKHLRYFVHSTEEMEWLHTTPDKWEKLLGDDDSLPPGEGTRILPLIPASV